MAKKIYHLIFIISFLSCCFISLVANAQETLVKGIDSSFVDLGHGNTQLRFIHNDKKGTIKITQAIIYSNGFISAIIDYKDHFGHLLGTRFAMRADRAGGKKFVTSKIFTDQKLWPENIIKLNEKPKIPAYLEKKLRLIGQLEGVNEAMDGIKNIQKIANSLDRKSVKKINEIMKEMGGNGNAHKYKSGIPWHIFYNRGKAGDDSNGGGTVQHGQSWGDPTNENGTVTYNDTYTENGETRMTQTSYTYNDTKHETRESSSSMWTDDNAEDGPALWTSGSERTQTYNADGSPKDASLVITITNVGTGERTVFHLNSVDGSSVGVGYTERWNAQGQYSRTENYKKNVDYENEGWLSYHPTTDENKNQLSPEEEEIFWQSLPWYADVYYINWLNEKKIAFKRRRITQPVIDSNGGNSSSNDNSYHPYYYTRSMIINCGEAENNICFPAGKITTDPRQTWRNISRPPPPTININH